MKRTVLNWQITLAFILITCSATIYYIHYLIFKDAHHIFIYLLGDIGFLFIDVLIVMLVLNRLLELRDRQLIRKKLNMVIGTFFCEVGTDLVRKSVPFETDLSDFTQRLIVTNNWTDKEFRKARLTIEQYELDINSKKGNLADLKDFLIQKRQFLLSLLENPNILDHESFTNLLWAVFHLTDELSHRTDLHNLPETDYQHLAGDIKRAYHSLILEWLDYMKYLKSDYPYLFSLALRTNPFDAKIKVEVQ
ncbi:MAG TPA: hypothetical protein PKL77_08245 [Candidatus Omnitrophota bacterium]|nr:hypothetical protein [Candidatus Omnitrophota bacterium]HPT07657.1 hypothetical protein [Candidatus Omnitrophota bacterium]